MGVAQAERDTENSLDDERAALEDFLIIRFKKVFLFFSSR